MADRYGSAIEAIARGSIASSQQRMASQMRLMNALTRYQANQGGGRRRRNNGPPVGMNGGLGRDRNRGRGRGGKGGKMPRVGVQGRIRPNAKIVTIKDFQGHTVQVNKSVADEFRRFLKALKKRGYNIESIGGYANRNIAGTSTPSLHSYGLAIDINPSANPVSYGKRITNMPRGIGKLSRKYGITWGGNWKGGKKDPMHFSFPYFGTK